MSGPESTSDPFARPHFQSATGVEITAANIDNIVSVRDQPEGVHLGGTFFGSLEVFPVPEGNDPISETDQERLLIGGVKGSDPRAIDVIFVNSFSDNGYGEAFIDSRTTDPADPAHRRTAVVSIRAAIRPITMAHEIGHILLDIGPHSPTSTNLMYRDPAGYGEISGAKRLEDSQAKRAHGTQESPSATDLPRANY